MPLNDLQLNDAIIARLYSRSLVALENAPEEPPVYTKQDSNKSPVSPSGEAIPQKAQTGVSVAANNGHSAPQARFLGNNNKHILIVISNRHHAFLPEDHLSLLIKMLGACNLNIGDTAIVNLAESPLAYSDLQLQFQPKKMLFLGMQPSAIQMPADSVLFNIGTFESGLYLCAPSLDELAGDTAETKLLKSRLWGCLKQLFAIQ